MGGRRSFPSSTCVLASVLFTFLVGTACTRQAVVETGPRPDAETLTWTADLQSRGGSGIEGTVTALSDQDGTRATLEASGAAAGEAHPWHIHRGACGSGGDIVGDADAYPLLSVGGRGEASAEADLGVILTPGEDYHVNVHQSRERLGEIVACGRLRLM